MTDLPANDEVEVSLFGPGYGECVLVHLGNQEWMVVDSCVTPASGRLPAMDYLDSIGVDAASAVKLIVATHWHDDHIRGLTRVVEVCEGAEFIASNALRQDEFLALVEAFETRPMLKKATSGVKEYHRIISILAERALASAEPRQQKFALANRLLKRGPTPGAAGAVPWEVHSLSPSDASVMLALRNIRKLIPSDAEPKDVIVPDGPNHTAVVLWVQAGRVSLLLGSDLEETGDPAAGWTAIATSNERPTGTAHLMKVAHHGSANGDHPEVWGRMLGPDPIAVLTPFLRGDVALPKKTDIQRICGRTSRAYGTALPRAKRISRVEQLVSKTLPGGVKSIRQVAGPTGQVRWRLNASRPDENPRVRTFGSAQPLAAMLDQL